MGTDCEVKKVAATRWLALIQFQYVDVAGGESHCEVHWGRNLLSIASVQETVISHLYKCIVKW